MILARRKEQKQIRQQSVKDRRGPVRPRERPALIVRNRDEGGSRKFPNDVTQSWQVEPPVHGGEKRYAEATEERKRQPIDVSMDHVEIFRPLRDSLEQHGTCGVRIRPLSAQTECARPHRMKLAACRKGSPLAKA